MSKPPPYPEVAPQEVVPITVRLGGLTFVVALLFGLGLLISMGRAAWYPPPWETSVIAFFAFGVPMVALGMATYGLWENYYQLTAVFGWVCVNAGLVWALALFALVPKQA